MPGRAFRDQVVLITGASRGIGRELAVQLAEVGARVVLVARSPSELELVAEACRARGAEAVAVQADVTMEAQCRAAVERAVIEFGRLDVLINSAGISIVARFFAEDRARQQRRHGNQRLPRFRGDRSLGTSGGCRHRAGKGVAGGHIMSADRCAELTLRAAAGRRRELVMTARGRASRWLRLVMPGVVDRIAARAVGFSG